jgi:hypothetical protein
VTVDWGGKTYTAVLDADDIVTTWLGNKYIGEGFWTGSEIDSWRRRLPKPVRDELSQRLVAATRT